jgi:hypothetical protein
MKKDLCGEGSGQMQKGSGEKNFPQNLWKAFKSKANTRGISS